VLAASCVGIGFVAWHRPSGMTHRWMMNFNFLCLNYQLHHAFAVSWNGDLFYWEKFTCREFILILPVNESFIFIDRKMFLISRVVDEDRQLRQVQCCCPGNRLKLLTSGQHWQEFSASVPSSVTPRYVSLFTPSKCGWGHRRLCVSKRGGSPHFALLFPILHSLFTFLLPFAFAKIS